MQKNELKNHLCTRLIPFWKKMRDSEHGGYYGWMDSGLQVDKKAGKGCILNSRILWFFSNAAMCMEENAAERTEAAAFRWQITAESGAKKETGGAAGNMEETVGSAAEAAGSTEETAGGAVEEAGRAAGNTEETVGSADTPGTLREHADWAYHFLRERCLDQERGGVYWSVDYTGQPEDTTKHTYNQAFAVYALSSYYRAYRDPEALALTEELIRVIETKCFDEYGYREAQDREFSPAANDKLSENGVMADRTMNTLLHILEAYTEYLLACQDAEPAESRTGLRNMVRTKLHWILNLIESHVYNPELHRQEVFFNRNMESLIDLHSYGHDIEAAWLMDRCLDVLGEKDLSERFSPILRSLEAEVYKKAYTNHSLANECERGTVDTKRVWWVQAEAVVGFYNAWQRTGELRYREASEDIWQFIREHLVDRRPEGEWFWYTDQEGNPALEKPIVEPWKCPYHNGRMCMELMKRIHDYL